MNSELSIGNSSQCITQNEDLDPNRMVTQHITVILPAYNEEVSIGSIVILAKLYADKIIVVDDGSKDRTADIAKKAGKGLRTRHIINSAHLLLYVLIFTIKVANRNSNN